MFTKQARQRGLSLVELLMFIVIVSVALVGILQLLNLTNRGSADPLRRKQALAIAESLLEEVQLAGFTFCDPTDPQAASAVSPVVGASGLGCSSAALIENSGQEAGGVARPFDNVNDYISQGFGVEDPSAFNIGGVLADAAGVPIGINGYRASLTITPEPLGAIPSTANPLTMNVLRIRVTVTYDDNKQIVLDGYRTRYAPN